MCEATSFLLQRMVIQLSVWLVTTGGIEFAAVGPIITSECGPTNQKLGCDWQKIWYTFTNCRGKMHFQAPKPYQISKCAQRSVDPRSVTKHKTTNARKQYNYREWISQNERMSDHELLAWALKNSTYKKSLMRLPDDDGTSLSLQSIVAEEFQQPLKECSGWLQKHRE